MKKLRNIILIADAALQASYLRQARSTAGRKKKKLPPKENNKTPTAYTELP